ncbi:MAG: phenylalanine--tRNA ligase subunit alpha [Deltaproteobacteria bacterium]|nr:MAG: phenylalanine--tRNA ligase subunit alpha [Desulfobacterium sp. 4572_20]RLB18576.1 MAG: phenylalanine--tRNA ligase subunit alpha [Deltaproteobacteria bacterium]RLB23044.1 MAG: phenylalanine--tRNA ligase subunit alpha [Deltaproteobacteria bacterium]HDH86484.1 phenylalanine--tRNA ligase subunit alpha [Desulfobacteraceae bacterium]
MKDQLLELKMKALKELESVSERSDLEKLRQQYLGRKGLLALLLKKLTALPKEERPVIGKLANQVKEELHKQFQFVSDSLTAKAVESESAFDVTLPGRRIPLGHLHPITKTTEEICTIFSTLGFRVVEGPEVELDYYNFEALNMPKDHPARDIQDTFYVSDTVVLRTHTSPMQIRIMESQSPPVSIIAPGKVYRPDSDVSHTPMFHQVEGLLVDKGITFGDLKGTLTTFIHQIFAHDTKLRFRTGFFPFTEPSAEVDIQCVICKGAGCRTCSYTGWIEILGSGMVDPEVFKAVGYDPENVSGFAFGMGVERIAMLKSGLDDIRLFFENDIRFLQQF